MARPNLLRENGIRQDAEIHDRALGEVGGVMDVCRRCGRIIRSTVVDVDGHTADCPGVCEHGVSYDDPCARCEAIEMAEFEAQSALEWGDGFDG